jgi:hypothetical protein
MLAFVLDGEEAVWDDSQSLAFELNLGLQLRPLLPGGYADPFQEFKAKVRVERNLEIISVCSI